MIIVTLSVEPVADGQHLSRIRELRERMPGKLLVLAPERLKMLTVLRDICDVYSGCGSLRKLVRLDFNLFLFHIRLLSILVRLVVYLVLIFFCVSNL